MKFKKAVKKMKNGYEVYRPHWDYRMSLCMDKKTGNILEYHRDDSSYCAWLSNAADILADDWECEVYVSLTC